MDCDSERIWVSIRVAIHTYSSLSDVTQAMSRAACILELVTPRNIYHTRAQFGRGLLILCLHVSCRKLLKTNASMCPRRNVLLEGWYIPLIYYTAYLASRCTFITARCKKVHVCSTLLAQPRLAVRCMY